MFLQVYALGQSYLKIKNKKVKLEMSQAVLRWQIHLINEFQKLFEKNKIKIGQILITPDDTEQRRRALNARRTFENLFKLEQYLLLMKMILQLLLKLNMEIMIDWLQELLK